MFKKLPIQRQINIGGVGMNRNIDENGRYIRRHLYQNDNFDRAHLAILGLLSTKTETYGYEVIFSVGSLYRLVFDDLGLDTVLGKDELTFSANLVLYGSKGEYDLVFDDDNRLIGIKPNRERLLLTIGQCVDQPYLVGSVPSEGYDSKPKNT